MPQIIKRILIREYSDNGQRKAYVEWDDGSRTEGETTNPHIRELLAKGIHTGLTIERERW